MPTGLRLCPQHESCLQRCFLLRCPFLPEQLSLCDDLSRLYRCRRILYRSLSPKHSSQQMVHSKPKLSYDRANTHSSTSAGSAFCDKKIYSYSTISTLITEWGCSPAPGTYSVYDAYILQTAGASPTTTVAPVISNGIAGASPAGGGSSPGVSKNTPTVGPVVTPTPSPSTTSASSSKGLGGGAIAGIVVGAIFVILFGLGMILLYRFITRRSRERRQQQQLQQQQQNEAFQQGGMTQHHRPSNITMPSTTPLVLPATSELSPADSASQIGGYSSTISSHPESGLGPLPNQFSAPPHVQPASSVASPGSAFGSMAPAHAPDL